VADPLDAPSGGYNKNRLLQKEGSKDACPPSHVCRSQLAMHHGDSVDVSSAQTGVSRPSLWLTLDGHSCCKSIVDEFQVFPLHRSITAGSPGGSAGVSMAHMPTTALPAAALGPAELQTVAELATPPRVRPGRAFQRRTGRLCGVCDPYPNPHTHTCHRQAAMVNL